MRRYGGRESDYSVCPRPLLQFLQFFLFMSDRLRQVMPGYIRLSQLTLEGRDVELDKNLEVFMVLLDHSLSSFLIWKSQLLLAFEKV